jgi:hypothetical protein
MSEIDLKKRIHAQILHSISHLIYKSRIHIVINLYEDIIHETVNKIYCTLPTGEYPSSVCEEYLFRYIPE